MWSIDPPPFRERPPVIGSTFIAWSMTAFVATGVEDAQRNGVVADDRLVELVAR